MPLVTLASSWRDDMYGRSGSRKVKNTKQVTHVGSIYAASPLYAASGSACLTNDSRRREHPPFPQQLSGKAVLHSVGIVGHFDAKDLPRVLVSSWIHRSRRRLGMHTPFASAASIQPLHRATLQAPARMQHLVVVRRFCNTRSAAHLFSPARWLGPVFFV